MIRAVVAIVLAGVVASSALAASPQVEVTREVHHDVSAPLRDIAGPAAPRSLRVMPLRRVPAPKDAAQALTVQRDGALQTQTFKTLDATTDLNLLGLGKGFKGPQGSFSVDSVPPDTNGAVGDTQVVESVNASYAVFDKATGAVVAGPIAARLLWKGFGGGCETNDDGDGIVLFDKMAHRWILSQFSISTKPYLECVAISQTNDATGAYYRYAFQQPNFNDYPKFGVWPDAIYVTYSMYKGNTLIGPRVCALNRLRMLKGASTLQECFSLTDQTAVLLPADFDGKRLPPSGAPNTIIGMGTNKLLEWSFHADFATPSNATLTGPVNIPVAAFTPACGLSTQVCAPQKGVLQKLDTLSDRLMFRLAYRNFPNASPAYESLVVTHTVKSATAVAAIRWYEIRGPGASPVVYQQGTFSPDGVSRFVGSAAMDKQGNLLIGYNASSATQYPSIRLTGRLAGDPLDTLSAETIAFSGGGSERGGAGGRWGDYSAMSVDPTDDCTFWYFNEYYPTNDVYGWATRLISAKFPSCS